MQWLIDGHNLIGQMPGLRLDDPNDESKLIEYLRRYCGRTGHRITVIFDAGQSYRQGETKKYGCVTVQFAPLGQSADHLLRQRLGRVQNPQEMILVSSDREVQASAQHTRVRVLAAGEFARQLLQTISGRAEADSDSRADPQLSADEVDEWLKIFKNKKHAPIQNQPIDNRKSGGPSSPRSSPGTSPPAHSQPGSRTGSNQKRSGRS